MNELIPPSSRLALFDFDGTLCRLNSYHVLLKWLMKRPTPFSLKIIGATTLRKVRLVTRPTLMKIALSPLKGKTREEIEAIGQIIFETRIFPNIRQAGISEMQKRNNEGYKVIILSGAFDFLLKPFCDLYKIDHWQSTRLAYQNNIFTGKLEGIEFLGEEKRNYLQSHSSLKNIRWHESCAYSDELVDLPLFSMVGNSFFVVSDQNKLPPPSKNIQLVFW